MVKVERQTRANVGKCFESYVDQFSDATCTQQIDGIKEGHDDEVGKVEAS